nr:alpha/beta hydrolase [Paracoccaceae bacterium]
MFRVLGIVAFLTVAGCGVYVDQQAGAKAQSAEERWPAIGAFTEVQGVSVHYVQKGTGPDLVLLHGAGGNLRDFTFELVDRLARDYRVTAFDRPGLGYTERLPQATGAFNTQAETPQQQAALLSAAARQIGIRNPIVLGCLGLGVEGAGGLRQAFGIAQTRP